ncbi:MAG: helix-turn-helix domain-containing protein, partial [Candidatus Dadabacteria bacterium]
LTANEKLVLIYFMRRADKKGRSFPSVERICRDCGFGSRNTAYKAMKTLINAGLIRREPVPGRSHNCFVSQKLYQVIEGARKRSAGKRNGPDESSGHLTDLSHNVTETSDTCSLDEQGCSCGEQPGVQNMNTKEYTVEGNTNKEHTELLKNTRANGQTLHEEERASSSRARMKLSRTVILARKRQTSPSRSARLRMRDLSSDFFFGPINPLSTNSMQSGIAFRNFL